ncbi:sensor histidine kinase [Desulfitibacter alkalitolerans]|uniref:sensor histidine kinase n=1 Tax=Desulfitibacter alkalitolerans TaxID=264641 RepID=UPI0004849AD7|nr:sensor histidine kinase [Desulfitibacter alkalitolerans]
MGIFTDKMIITYSFYGLAFFTMFIVIASQVRKDSSFILAKPLWFLSLFGLFQALAEWSKVAKLLHIYGIALLDIFTLHVLDVLTIGISAAFLFLFGIHLIIASRGKFFQLKYLPLLIAILWFAKFIVLDLIIFPTDNLRLWNAESIAWSRYLLVLPGSILVSIGLILQLPILKRLHLKSAYYHCLGAAVTFIAYGFFSGLITFPVDFWPGTVLNSVTFVKQTGISVQHIRAVLGLLMVYTIIRTINIFNVEQHRRLEEAEKLSVLMKERKRFSIDLHDGVIQSIYAAGLCIETIQNTLKHGDLEKADQQLEAVKKRLNTALNELRSYIVDLDKETEGSLQHLLTNLIHEFRSISMINIDLIDETKEVLYLQQAQENNVFHIVQEALFNVIKHAKASKVKIILEEGTGNKITIRIIDNGIGYDPKEYLKNGLSNRKGLTNMHYRTERLGGSLTVNTQKGKGTEVILQFKKGS